MNKDRSEILKEVLDLEQSCGSIIDAIVTVCEKYDIEIETLARYIKYSKEIKERVGKEGVALKMLNL